MKEKTHYLVDGKKWKVMFVELYQPKHYGVYFYTPGIEIYSNEKSLNESRNGIVFMFFFWIIEITYSKSIKEHSFNEEVEDI